MYKKILLCLQTHDIQLLQGTSVIKPCLPFATGSNVVVTVEDGDNWLYPYILYVHPFFLSPLLSSPLLSSPLSSLLSLTACDLVSLGRVDVFGPGSEALLAQTVQQIKSLELSTMNIVTFKASKEGITLTDNVNGWVRGGGEVEG